MNLFGFASSGGVVASMPQVLASVDEGGPNDVFIGLANAAKNAPGTVALQELVREYNQRFEIAVTKTTGRHAIFSTTVTQTSVSREIFSKVQKRGGQFYCKPRGSDVWEEATNSAAIAYITLQSEHGKAIRKEYKQSEHGKVVIRKYEQSEHGKAIRKEYKQSEHGKAVIRKYDQSERRKAVRKEYEQSEHGKAVIQTYQREYRQSEHGKAIERACRQRKKEREALVHVNPLQFLIDIADKGENPFGKSPLGEPHFLDVKASVLENTANSQDSPPVSAPLVVSNKRPHSTWNSISSKKTRIAPRQNATRKKERTAANCPSIGSSILKLFSSHPSE